MPDGRPCRRLPNDRPGPGTQLRRYGDPPRHAACLILLSWITAVCLQTPVYAVDATDGQSGEPGSIHRSNLDPGGAIRAQDLHVGETHGQMTTRTKVTIDMGLNALRIWGRTASPISPL